MSPRSPPARRLELERAEGESSAAGRSLSFAAQALAERGVEAAVWKWRRWTRKACEEVRGEADGVRGIQGPRIVQVGGVLAGKALTPEKICDGHSEVGGSVVPVSICVCDPIFGAYRVAIPDTKTPVFRPTGGTAGMFKKEMVVV